MRTRAEIVKDATNATTSPQLLVLLLEVALDVRDVVRPEPTQDPSDLYINSQLNSLFDRIFGRRWTM